MRAVIEEFYGPFSPSLGVKDLSKKKRNLVIFSGHKVDPKEPPPTVPRFPNNAQDRARDLIEAALVKLSNEGDHIEVLVSAAPGADILVLETCRRFNLATWICLSMQRETVAKEIFKDHNDWRSRFFDLTTTHPRDQTFVLSNNGGLPQWLGARSMMTAWSCGSRWMLHQAQAWGADRVTLLMLWDHKK